LSKFISIIIPAFNESSRISRALIPTIDFLKNQNYESEIIVVNDGSTDKTSDRVKEYSSDFKDLKIIEYSPNRGKGYAVKAGMLQAEGKYRLFMDADYAVPIEYLKSMLKEITNYDIVIGSRGLKESVKETRQNFFREKLAILFGKIQRIILNLPIIDTQCGFKLFTDSSAELLFNLITLECSLFDAELLYIAQNKKMRIKEYPVRWKHDNETRLPIGIKRSIELLFKLFRIRSIHKLKVNK
jgi:dolichyl-phosphate beta-glucosyltransferase